MLDVNTREGCDLREVARHLRPFVAARVAADDVDDVLQEILTHVHTGFDDLADSTRFLAWLYRIARNAIADHHRSAHRVRRKHEALGDAAVDVDVSLDGVRDDAFDEDDLAAHLALFVQSAIALLPEPHRRALQRSELDGVALHVLAVEEGVSLSGMKSRVQRGRRMLRELFEACCEIALDVRGHVVDVQPR